jgi:glycerol-3-phosphate acyltransferase PlsY
MTYPDQYPAGPRRSPTEETQIIPRVEPRPASTAGPAPETAPTPDDAGYAGFPPEYQAPTPEAPRQPEPPLLAGKFDAKKAAVNLGLLGVLGAVVTFAIALIVDQVVARVTGDPAQGTGQAVIIGVIAGIIGVLAGLLYVPVADTGNEGLFTAAIVTLTVAAAAVYVIFGGLLDGRWDVLVSLAGIICAGVIALAASSRVESTRVYHDRQAAY